MLFINIPGSFFPNFANISQNFRLYTLITDFFKSGPQFRKIVKITLRATFNLWEPIKCVNRHP